MKPRNVPPHTDRNDEVVPSKYATPPADTRLPGATYTACRWWNDMDESFRNAPLRAADKYECPVYVFQFDSETGDLTLETNNGFLLTRTFASCHMGRIKTLDNPNDFSILDDLFSGSQISDAWQYPDDVLVELTARWANHNDVKQPRDLQRVAGALSIMLALRHGCEMTLEMLVM